MSNDYEAIVVWCADRPDVRVTRLSYVMSRTLSSTPSRRA